MKVEQLLIPERPLIDCYRHNFNKLQEFYEYNPYDPTCFQTRFNDLGCQSFPRRELVETLHYYNELINAGEETQRNIELLAAADTVVVITGQQAGVLTGPLYTIYKALTVLQLATKLQAQGIKAVPAFWIASEDHDFQEISSIYVLNREHQEVEVKLAADVGREPVGGLKLKAEVQAFLDNFAEVVPKTDFTPEILTKLRTFAWNSANLAEWFARIMAWLFQGSGLIFVDSLLPGLRQLGREFFCEVLAKNDQISSYLNLASEQLNTAGFQAQIKKDQKEVHLFLIEENARYPLEKMAGGYSLRGTKKFYTSVELTQRICKQPETVSTNVVTRPLLQDLLFPTMAYVGGPGETAYFAQYRQIYQLFNLKMPIIYPRAGVTLIEKTVAKGLNKYNLTPLQIYQQFAKIKAQYLAEADELNIQQRFNRLKGQFIPEYQKLIKDLQQLDVKFEVLGRQNLQRILEEISYLEEKAAHQHRKNSEDILNQLDKIRNNLYPGDLFQERRFNIIPYLLKYQQGLVMELAKLDLISSSSHNLVYL